MKILVLGATGLLGKAVFCVLGKHQSLKVWGTIRNATVLKHFSSHEADNLILVEDLENIDHLEGVLARTNPDVVINCVSLSNLHEQKSERVMSVFAVFPRKLSWLCRQANTRLIQIGSDGVFSGKKGNYRETDFPDAQDSYGTAKFLGEVYGDNEITIRTSIIGHDPVYQRGLLEWFLRETECHLHTRAIFSGFPTTTLARIIKNEILTRPNLCGLYHIASDPISKFDLLSLVAKKYGLSKIILADDRLVINRALNAEKFTLATGYRSPDWSDLVDEMHTDSTLKR